LLLTSQLLIATQKQDRYVLQKTRASMRVNSESVLNEIDESDLQCENQNEERI
jgi:hypothetical protein